MKRFKHIVFFSLLFFLIGVSSYCKAGGIKVVITDTLVGKACVPVSIFFRSYLTGASPGKINYLWSFSSGSSSTDADPIVIFTTCGPASATLTVKDSIGQVGTLTINFNIVCPPVPDFSATPTTGCSPLTVTYTNNSTLNGPPPFSYRWDFCDGTSDTSATPPPHVFNYNSKCYCTTLSVTNSDGCQADVTKNNLICVTKPPQASFTSSTPSSCAVPYTVNYSSTSTGTGLIYKWVFPGGTATSTSTKTTSVTYKTLGSYSVTLTVTDANGCTSTVTFNNYVNLNGNNFNFSQSASSVCLGSPITFTGVPALTNKWIFTPLSGGATIISVNEDTTITFTNPGSYQVCYSVTFTGGCSANKCDTIVVNPVPTAAFTVSGNVPVCAPPEIVKVTNTSLQTNGNIYAWSFGGTPSTSSSYNPGPITYSKCGDYGISLVVTNTAGCSATASNDTAVKINCPQASFFYINKNPIKACAPTDTVTFYASGSTGQPVKYYWNFNIDTFPNNWVEAPISSTAGVDQDSIVHIFTKSGCYTVGLKIVNAKGCSDTTTRSGICLGVMPKACFSATPLSVCVNKQVNFANCSKHGGGNPPSPQDTLLTYTWQFGDGQKSNMKAPQHLYMDTGHYDIKLTVCNEGCCDTFSKKKYIHVNAPKGNLNVVPVDCSNPFCRTFEGGQSEAALTYNWVFPTGSTISSQSSNNAKADSTVTVCFPPTNTDYVNDITLIVTNGNCADTVSTTVYIRNLKSKVTPMDTAGCAPFNVTFNNESSGAYFTFWKIFLKPNLTTPVFTYNIANVAGLDHVFTTPGNYALLMTAEDVNRCRLDAPMPNITVYGVVPVFTGTPLSGCPPLTVTFTSQTTASSTSSPSQYKWIYGDGDSSGFSTSTVSPAHTYSNPGTYDVMLVVLDNKGCYDTLTKPAYVSVILPVANFTADSLVCAGSKVCFTNLSTGSNLTYKWNFGDTASSTAIQSTALNPCHEYDNVGQYNVGLVVVDANGCRDSIYKSPFINVGTMTASFTADTTFTNCPPLQVNFTNTSTGLDASSTFNWVLAPGINATVENPNHLYTTPGDYMVSLTETNHYGCQLTVTEDSFIHLGGPTARVVSSVSSVGCVPLTVCFSADSSTATSYIWDFGDGVDGPTDSSQICHLYRYTGTYHAAVILGDGTCNYPYYIDTLTVVQDTAFFTADKHYLCGSGTVKFTDSSRALSPITYRWDFGDPVSGVNDSSKLKNPSHFYSSMGTYVVTETSIAQPGCLGTFTDTIRVTGAPLANFTYNGFGDCVNTVIQFTDSSTSGSPIVSHRWIFGDPSSGSDNLSDSLNPAHSFKAANTYAVTLIDSSVSGCVDSITKNIAIANEPIAYAGSDKTICSNTSVLLRATGGGTYAWSPAQSLSDSTIASPAASPTVQTTYTVTVTDGKGCAGHDSVVVNVLYPFTAHFSSDTCVCRGASVQLGAIVNGLYNYHYKWTPAFGLNSTSIENPIATPDSDTHYRVIVFDSLCYADSGYVSVCVYPVPSLYVGPSLTITAGEPTQLGAQTNATSATFKWSPASSLNCSDCPNPTATTNAPVTYKVTVTDANGCSSEDSVKVFVFCNGASIFVPNAFTPNNDGLNDVFTITGSGIKELKYLRIYDRWGEKIFETNSLSDGWDGTSKGQLMETGVYVYYIEAVCQNGVQFIKKGNVTLIR